MRYTKDIFNEEVVSSIGVDFKSKDIKLGDKKIKLQIWDTAGHERYRTITQSYYRGAHTIVTVFDLTNRESYIHVQRWLEEINKFAKENVLKFIIGNKADLTKQRNVTYDEARTLSQKLKIPYLETSAKNSFNVNEFFEIAASIYVSHYDFAKDKELSGIHLDVNKHKTSKDKKKKNKNDCC